MIFTLLSRLSQDPDLKIIAVAFNEGTLSQSLRRIGVETFVIDEAKHGFFTMLMTAHSILRSRGVQLVHAHGYKANLLAWCLSKSVGITALVSTVHGLPEATFAGSPFSRSVDNVRKMLDRRLLRRAFSRVVAVSQDIKNVLVNEKGFLAGSVELIYNGIETSPGMLESSSSSESDCIHIGTVGRMVPVKDFPLFLKIAAELRTCSSHVRFSILGDGPMKQDLVQLVKGLELEECIRFETPRPDPFPYYQSLDIYLNTSRHEGLPLSLLEAMACGKPIVAPYVGGIPEVVGDGEQGFLVRSREVKDFVKPCLRLVHDRDLRVALGKNAAECVVERFSSSQMTTSYQHLYERLIFGAGMDLRSPDYRRVG